MQFRFQRLFAPSVHLRSCRATLIHGLSCSSWTSTNNAALNLNLRLWQLWQDVKKNVMSKMSGSLEIWRNMPKPLADHSRWSGCPQITVSATAVMQGPQLRVPCCGDLWQTEYRTVDLYWAALILHSWLKVWNCLAQQKRSLFPYLPLSLSVPLPPSLYLPISLSRSLLSLSL